MPPIILAVLLALSQFAQTATGELRVIVTDASHLSLPARVEVLSESTQVHEERQADTAGTAIVKALPFGVYRITVSRDGFAPFSDTVEIRSALPTLVNVTLSVAPQQGQVTVTAAGTLLDPRRAGSNQRIGADAIRRRPAALPGRSLPDLVNTQPGWLMEANGVLHPRGSEYQTQYIVDGLPLTDNRSPAFAPEIDADDVHALNILTGGYPAEYGRKLGGVIEVTTAAEASRGVHASFVGSLGAFATRTADGVVGWGWRNTSLLGSFGATGTDRYLDPPVEENFTNHGTTEHGAFQLNHDFSDTNRFGAILRYGRSEFLVPNELVQEGAGQVQSRGGDETMGQFSFQHIFSANALADVRALLRDLSATLASNNASTPIIASQDRGVRDMYVKATASLHAGQHEWKFGGDVIAGTVREQFGYTITDPEHFEPETPPTFAFADDQPDREASLFVQDRVAAGPWTVNAGLRWDDYHLVVSDQAFSPRASVAWSWPNANLVLRASYDRAFQTPAVENLLLASSRDVDALSQAVLRLPVPPSAGNFYDVGVSTAIADHLRVDASYYRRTIANFADDDVLLNTGVSFPIAFRRGEVEGTEVKLDLTPWRGWSGGLSYTLMKGVGELPVTGGLLLGAEAGSSANDTATFPISQDQRHTVRGRVAWQVTRSAWTALGVEYGSGLPFEFEGDEAQALEQYGPRIVERVNFETERVRPSFTLDAAAGYTLAKSATRRFEIQVDVRNLTDQLNVINFAGLFSGTAIAPPRSVAVRLRAGF